MTIHVENDNSQTLVTTAETLVLSGITQDAYGGSGLGYTGGPPAQPVPNVINVTVNVTPGASTTGQTVRIRHGVNSIAGALVGVAEVLPVNGGTVEFLDATGDLNGYSVSVAQVAATGNGTVNAVAMDINQQ